MAHVKTQAQPLLLVVLLLGLWVAEVPVSAKPKDMTSAQWFETQHVQPSPQKCNIAMRNINQYSKRCKTLNTFLHNSFANVATTCQTPNVACKNGRKNCHESNEPMSLTMCEHISGKYPDCKYRETHQDAFFIVACDPPQEKDDQTSELLPVHLDGVF